MNKTTLLGALALCANLYANEPSTPAQATAPMTPCSDPCSASCHDDPCCKESFLKRLLRTLFARKCDPCAVCCEDACICSTSAPLSMTPAPAEAPMPKVEAPAPKPAEPTPPAKPAQKPAEPAKPAPKPPAEIKTSYQPDVVERTANYAPDYKWLQGNVHWVHVNGGAWVVRYMPLDKSDKYGGSMVLASSKLTKSLKEGDFVKIEGEILNEKSSILLGGPLYRAKTVNVLQASMDNKIIR